jgi:hypothetical protein
VPPTPKRLIKYIGENWVEEIIDDENNVLVLPETLYKASFQFMKIRKVLWWLSVDNFFPPLGIMFKGRSAYTILKDAVKKQIKRYPYNLLYKIKDSSNISLHLVQSYYAKNFLEKRNIKNIIYLSDYINLEFVGNANAANTRLNQVIYNPAKAGLFTNYIIGSMPNIKWIPIKKMQPKEVAELMSLSKVYIDFGSHPGKDRIPREAALNGCCVITGYSGAAKNEKDIPIPGKYKFKEEKKNIPNIINTINFCLLNFEIASEDFRHYRETILKEEDKFELDLKLFLEKLCE